MTEKQTERRKPDGESGYIGTVPSVFEQAKERARDDLTRTELTNMLFDFPHVCECLVDGDDEPWRPTTITVGFDSDGHRDTSEVATVMRRAGYDFDHATFGPFNRLTFEERSETDFNSEVDENAN